MSTLPVRARSVFVPSIGCTTHAPNAAHEQLDPATVAELNAWHDDHDAPPTDGELDLLYAEYRDAMGFDRDVAAPLADCVALPRALSDETLAALLAMADAGDPHGHLQALGVCRDGLPDFAAACAAEMVAQIRTGSGDALAA